MKQLDKLPLKSGLSFHLLKLIWIINEPRFGKHYKLKMKQAKLRQT